jgi:molybdate transport system substrate-binding protein
MGPGFAAFALATVVVATACGGGRGSDPTGSGPSRPKAITVFAAASLTNVFGAEAKAYTAKTGGRVTLSFAGSQDLVAQLKQGAPADVLATADLTTMRDALSGGQQTAPVFARNRLVIVTESGNPKHVTGLSDLSRSALIVVLAAPSVPAGKYAAAALTAAHVVVHPKSLEDNVRGVLTKIELGEADAGVVYATDAKSAAGKVAIVAIQSSPIATYPAVALDSAGAGFVEFLLSAVGQAVLRSFAFLPPT